MWIRISKIAKTVSFSTQSEVEIFQKLIPAKPSTIIVENTENLPNLSSDTIDRKSVRNSHLLFQKIGIFSSATSIALYTKRKFLTRKVSKQQLTAHTSIVKRITVSVTNTHLSSSNAQLYQLVPQMHKLLKQIKPTDIANYNINRYNGSFFSY